MLFVIIFDLDRLLPFSYIQLIPSKFYHIIYHSISLFRNTMRLLRGDCYERTRSRDSQWKRGRNTYM